MAKIVHISDIHVHDRSANLSVIADGIKSLFEKGDPVRKGLSFLSKGVSAVSLVKRMGYSVSEDRPDIRKTLLDDIEREEPDHIILSGDVTNTALESECEEARRSFEKYIPERRLSFVPGNHDFPVFLQGTAKAVDYFHDSFPDGNVHFPYVKLLGKRLALIGLNSCLEIFDFLSTPEVVVHTARGKLDRDQLLRLSEVLSDPRLEGRYKIVVLHHHVVSARAGGRGRLRKAQEYFMEKAVNSDYLLKLLAEKGVGMVLHGHRHVRNILTAGSLVVVGAGSSVHPEPDGGPPSYHVYEFDGEIPRIKVKALEAGRFRPVFDERFLPPDSRLAPWRHD